MAELTQHDKYRLPLSRRLTGGARVLPDFLILGAQKAGTTTIYDNMVKHPAIHPCDIKEVHFFDSNWHRGENWYRAHFPTIRAREAVLTECEPWITGEGSPYYLFHPQVPSRAKTLCPHAKLIVALRNPVDRAYSHYQHEKRKGRETLGFEEALAAEDQRLAGEAQKLKNDGDFKSFAYQHFSYKARGLYADQLEDWFHYFPRDRFFILDSADLDRDFEGTFEALFEFLGVPGFELEAPKRSNVGNYEKMPEDVRLQLGEYFAPHNRRLEELLGRKFTF